MKLNKEDMIKMLEINQINTDNLILMRDRNHELNQKLFHAEWKVRYLTRRLKAIDPHEAVTEEELDEMLHRKEQ